MPRKILNSNETYIMPSSDMSLYGQSGEGTEVVKLLNNQLRDINIDPHIERIEFTGNLSDYQFKIVGNIVSIRTDYHQNNNFYSDYYSPDPQLVNITLENSVRLAFADGAADLTISALNTAYLNNTSISIAASNLLDNIILDKNDVSHIETITISDSIFSLDISNDTIITGDTITAIVSRDTGTGTATIDLGTSYTPSDYSVLSVYQTLYFEEGELTKVIDIPANDPKIPIDWDFGLSLRNPSEGASYDYKNNPITVEIRTSEGVTVNTQREVSGGISGNDAVRITGSAGAIIDQTIERVEFSSVLSDYTFSLVNNTLMLNYLDGNKAASIAIQDDADGTRLAFSNGFADFILTDTETVSFAGTSILSQTNGAYRIDLDSSAYYPFIVGGNFDYGGAAYQIIDVFANDNQDSYDMAEAYYYSSLFYFEQGSYQYTIHNALSVKSELFFAEGSNISILNTALDGELSILSENPMTGGVIEVILKDIDLDIDRSIFSLDSLKSATDQYGIIDFFTEKEFVEQNIFNWNNNISEELIKVDAQGIDNYGANSKDASNANFTFDFVQGYYEYSISNFSSGDKLDFLDDAELDLYNIAVDGVVDIISSNGATGVPVRVHITGLSAAEDSQLVSIGDFVNIFGTDSIIGVTPVSFSPLI